MAIRPMALGFVVVLTLATRVVAQTAAPPPQQPPPPQTPPPPAQDVTYKETVVVSASKTEQQLVDAPATMTVIGPRALSVAPSNNYADLLRNVPGVNVTQISARDVNITSRSATSSLATSQLAVVDGRSIYQDFFGFTMWDFMPNDLDEIKRVEVIRGPASAVWGANALTGVVNVITKSPRENPGTTVTLGGGTLDREVADNAASNGGLYYIRGVHSQVVNDRWAYKISAGTYNSDPFARPVGLVPNGGTTPFPTYANQGTTQPKFDGRADYDFPDGERKMQFSGGYAGTDGIMHSGIGPFDVHSGSAMGYGKFNFTRKAFKLQAFMNVLDGTANNLVSVNEQGVPIDLTFNTKTFDVEVGNTSILAAKHVLTYGGNLRFNRFDLTIAPDEDSRNEGGGYIQDEILLSDQFRVVAGARLDKFSSIDNAVFSPRIAAVIKPTPDQSVRVSYNRAFRAPSMVNNFLDVTLGTPLPLGLINPAFGSQIFLVPTHAVGNPDLVEESVDAYEVAYTGNIRNRASVSAAWYYTNGQDQIFFTTTGTWQTPPPGFPGLGPFPPSAIWAGLINQGIIFPSDYSYRNLGQVKSQGIELGVDGSLTNSVSAFVNYSFQAEPDPEFPNFTHEEALQEINIPARHLFNIGVSCVTPRTFGLVSVNHSSEAFWQDVLDARFHGTTKPYTMLNVTAGVKFNGGKYSAALKIVNLTNEEVQQHV
ncbi:MAG: TonB-dependent receptor plug domain-containing protein, partial [Acidobacteriota bacterium]